MKLSQKERDAIGYQEAADKEHECEFSFEVDCDICPSCKEHTGICLECGGSECCG